MITILEKNRPATVEDLMMIGSKWYESFLKGAVDIEQSRVAVGGEWYIEVCEALTSTGSHHEDVWGFNIMFSENNEIVFNSLINIKPSKGSKSMTIEDDTVIQKMRGIITAHTLMY